MCGLVGTVAPRDHLALDLHAVATALKSIEHRGPDNVSTWASKDGRVAVGHVRLAIIDPSASANQPMVSRDGRYLLVFNGEIYNFRDLYARFVADDDDVNPRSDTSVLFALLRDRGRDALSLLNGMFAFAFIDLADRSVLVARDRFGEKPFYFFSDGPTLSFASELVALGKLRPDLSWSLDQEAVQLYFMSGSITAPRTIFRGMRALPPASYFSWRPGTTPAVRPYWQLVPSAQPELSHKPPIEAVSSLLRRAVSSRMVSDVPVGIFLSGGIDSTSIVATAASQAASINTALSIDFPEVEFSEATIAAAVAKRFGLSFVREVVDSRSFIDSVPGFFHAMDQPTVDGFNTYFISRIAGQTGIKVWLSGVGGDELFGGYPSFSRLSRLEAASRYLQHIVPYKLVGGLPVGAGLSKVARLLHLGVRGNPVLRAYQVCRIPILPAPCRKLLGSPQESSNTRLQQLLDDVAPETAAHLDWFQKASLLEARVYLGGQLLRDIDNFSMAESIEIRAPFLDHDLFEGVWRLPQDLKKYNSSSKPLLIDSVPGGLPAEVPTHRKRGFTFPVQDWLRDNMGRQFQDVVLDPAFDDVWDRREVAKLWRSYKAGAVGWIPLWSFYAFANWRSSHNC
jgi:asparagine synthase (glutamine-hydrolysing)